MQFRATAKYIRNAPRKVKLVADMVRGMHAVRAKHTLTWLPKSAGKAMNDVLLSALANAKQKGVSEEALRIASIDVTGGPMLKRWHAASRGMAHGYKKRMSHVTVVLTDEKEEKQKKNEK